MCGIFAAVQVAGHGNVTGQMDSLLSRGRDSFGFVQLNAGEVKEFYRTVGKGVKSGEAWMQQGDILLCNRRAEPTTEYVQKKMTSDVQPYRHGSIFAVHNGTIANDKDLAVYTGARSTKIDSEVIPHMVSHFIEKGRSFRAACSHMVSLLKGSFALFVTDGYELFIATNYKPIYYSTDGDRFYLGSTAESVSLYGASPQRFPQYSTAFLTVEGDLRMSPGILYPEQNKRCLSVISGGMDSAVATQEIINAGYDVTLLHFRYACRAQEKEEAAISALAKHWDVPVQFVDVDLFTTACKSPLTNGADISGGEAGAEFAHEWVPARNLYMLATATAIAEAQGFNHLCLGNNLEEAGAYPDNEPEFIDRFNEILPYAMAEGKQLTIHQPVGMLMKHEIVALGISNETPFNLTWSCYNNGSEPCGDCGPCFMRKTAFEINKVEPL